MKVCSVQLQSFRGADAWTQVLLPSVGENFTRGHNSRCKGMADDWWGRCQYAGIAQLVEQRSPKPLTVVRFHLLVPLAHWV